MRFLLDSNAITALFKGHAGFLARMRKRVAGLRIEHRE